MTREDLGGKSVVSMGNVYRRWCSVMYCCSMVLTSSSECWDGLRELDLLSWVFEKYVIDDEIITPEGGLLARLDSGSIAG